MRCASAFTLCEKQWKVIIRDNVNISSSIVEGNAKTFSPVCDLKIWAAKDVGMSVVEVRLVKTLFFQTGDVVLGLHLQVTMYPDLY